MIIGLTGGIASGKSTVSKYLAEKGFKVYDADKIAKDISEKKLVQEEIILTFGDKILDKNGNVDRKKIKEIVFENKEKLKQLNAIIHPKVIDFYKELKEQNTDEIIIFISDYEIQLNRIVERDKIDRELAEKIIKSQLSNEERIKKADVVIENNSSLEDLFEKVERFCERI